MTDRNGCGERRGGAGGHVRLLCSFETMSGAKLAGFVREYCGRLVGLQDRHQNRHRERRRQHSDLVAC